MKYTLITLLLIMFPMTSMSHPSFSEIGTHTSKQTGLTKVKAILLNPGCHNSNKSIITKVVVIPENPDKALLRTTLSYGTTATIEYTEDTHIKSLTLSYDSIVPEIMTSEIVQFVKGSGNVKIDTYCQGELDLSVVRKF